MIAVAVSTTGRNARGRQSGGQMTPRHDQRAATGRSGREFLRTVGMAGYAAGVAQLLGVDDVLVARRKPLAKVEPCVHTSTGNSIKS